jgi:hypothetical protein
MYKHFTITNQASLVNDTPTTAGAIGQFGPDQMLCTLNSTLN